MDMCGVKSQNMEIVAIGMLGVLVGFIPISVINKVIRHPYLLAFSYLIYVATIAVYDVTYPLEVVGTCLSVAIIYLVGTIDRKPGWIRDEIILLGKYSLFGYIAQISILQILQAGLRHLGLRSAVLAISFSAAFLLLLITVKLTDRARVRAVSMDKLYKAVFN
jgi:hypothetical protein